VSGFVISSTTIFKSKHGLTKQLAEIVSGVEILMQSILLKYKLTVKFLAIFIQ
jgi:hypothetical protein